MDITLGTYLRTIRKKKSKAKPKPKQRHYIKTIQLRFKTVYNTERISVTTSQPNDRKSQYTDTYMWTLQSAFPLSTSTLMNK